MDAGANAYLLKDSAYSEIVAAIRAVFEGGYYVTQSMMGYLLNRQQHSQPPPTNEFTPSNLSPVERRILSLIAQKKSSKEIAEEFRISPRTIENRRAAICEKLGLSGANSLLKYALEQKANIQ
jgi:DNA-binding NarL/FixJ family response regulator